MMINFLSSSSSKMQLIVSHLHGAGNPAQARLCHQLLQQSRLCLHLGQLGPKFLVPDSEKLELLFHGVLLSLFLLAVSESCCPVLRLLPLLLLQGVGTHRWGGWLLPLVLLLHSSRLCGDGSQRAGWTDRAGGAWNPFRIRVRSVDVGVGGGGWGDDDDHVLPVLSDAGGGHCALEDLLGEGEVLVLRHVHLPTCQSVQDGVGGLGGH